MLIAEQLPRIFIHNSKGHDIRLADPDHSFSPEAVLSFYSASYPELVTARIEGPFIQNDEVVYTFSSTIGTKG